MSTNNFVSFRSDPNQNVIEISELIKIMLELGGVVQKRFRAHGYSQEAQIVLEVRQLLGSVFGTPLTPPEAFAEFISRRLPDESGEQR